MPARLVAETTPQLTDTPRPKALPIAHTGAPISGSVLNTRGAASSPATSNRATSVALSRARRRAGNRRPWFVRTRMLRAELTTWSAVITTPCLPTTTPLPSGSSSRVRFAGHCGRTLTTERRAAASGGSAARASAQPRPSSSVRAQATMVRGSGLFVFTQARVGPPGHAGIPAGCPCLAPLRFGECRFEGGIHCNNGRRHAACVMRRVRMVWIRRTRVGLGALELPPPTALLMR